MATKKNTNCSIDMAVLIERLDNLKIGIEGMHLRQDTTNGKVLKSMNDIVEIKTEMKNMVKKEDCAKLHYSSENQNLKDNRDLGLKKTALLVSSTSVLTSIIIFILGKIFTGGK